MRILLAEDDAALAQRLVPLLEQAGYVVAVVADGREAEEIGQIEDLQAAIVDLGLPGLDGLSVIERWRGNGRSFPVLVLRTLWFSLKRKSWNFVRSRINRMRRWTKASFNSISKPPQCGRNSSKSGLQRRSVKRRPALMLQWSEKF